MKKLLLILLALPMIGFGQQTYVPDDNFEAYLETNGMGNGIANDDYVTTANINTVTNLFILNLSITDITGVEGFTALTYLYCDDNQLTILDVSQNTALTELSCGNNQLTTLDVSQNTNLAYFVCGSNQLTSLDVNNNLALTQLRCGYNQLTLLDVSNNTALQTLYCDNNLLTTLDVSSNTALNYVSCVSNLFTSLDFSQNTLLLSLWCQGNQLTILDVSNNTALYTLFCDNNQLTSLDVRNGNNINWTFDDGFFFGCANNPSLTCIEVDDDAWSTANLTVANNNIDAQHYFSTNCSGTSIQEHTTNKELLKLTDILGRETKQTNQPLFYIYDDGTVEKRIVIE